MSDATKPDSEVREGSRIAKVMARAGLCSRRDAEAWIAAGRVSVNGKVLESPAYNVSDADDVRVDGQRLAAPERTRLFLFHKPRGLVTTARDPEGRATIFDALPPDLPRVVAIGRLDINTEGLLLLTNDGGLARVLELPQTGWLRRYRVRAHGAIDQARLDSISAGISLDGVDYAGIEAKLDREQGSNAWITMGLREGKNREIKKVLEHLGLAVNRLIRVCFGPFELGDLAEGEVAEVRTRVLRDQLGAKLAREAGVDFDAPLVERGGPPEEPHAAAPRPPGRGSRERDRGERAPERRGRKREGQGAPGRARRSATPRAARPVDARRFGESTSRRCAPRSPPTARTPPPRASGSSAARPMTGKAARSPSSASCRPAKNSPGARPTNPIDAAAARSGAKRGCRARARGAPAASTHATGVTPKRESGRREPGSSRAATARKAVRREGIPPRARRPSAVSTAPKTSGPRGDARTGRRAWGATRPDRPAGALRDRSSSSGASARKGGRREGGRATARRPSAASTAPTASGPRESGSSRAATAPKTGRHGRRRARAAHASAASTGRKASARQSASRAGRRAPAGRRPRHVRRPGGRLAKGRTRRGAPRRPPRKP